MTNSNAKAWVDKMFAHLQKAVNVSEVQSILLDPEISVKNKLSPDVYPPIQFKITEEEIREFKDRGVLSSDNTFTNNLPADVLNPITKLLYAIAWKNGDLKKVKHIVDGILECKEENIDRENGVVFYQFGRHLTKTPGEPIVDQHVLRAFAVHKSKELHQIEKLRKLSIISKKENQLICDYKNWLKDDSILQASLRGCENYTFHIDQVLFAIGKTIKVN